MNLAGADNYLLGRIFCPVAWFIERHTGANNFAQARWCAKASAVAICGWFLIWAHKPYQITLMGLPILVWIYLCGFMMQSIRRDEHRAQTKPEMWAWLVESMAGSRVTTLIVYSTVDVTLLTLGLDSNDYDGWRVIAIPLRFHSTLLGIATYLCAVPPAPPHKKRERRNWLAFLKLAPLPT